MTMATPMTIAICTDCLMLVANAETPPGMSEVETDEYIERIGEDRHITLGMMPEDHDDDCPNVTDDDEWEWVAECYCEQLGFSMSRCEMCWRPLGGDRYAATEWIGETA